MDISHAEDSKAVEENGVNKENSMMDEDLDTIKQDDKCSDENKSKT